MSKILPHLFITKIIGILANSKISLLKNLFINLFLIFYKPNLDEALDPDLDSYKTYNDFFIRKLKKEVRPINNRKDCFISPVDGEIVDHGFIKEGQLIQAKKHKYPLKELVGGELEKHYEEGYFVTIYLAPTDYHRIHCPYDGKITHSSHLGESLYSVNKKAQDLIPKLYIKNERSVLNVDSEFSDYALVSVGASVVGSIVPFWSKANGSSRLELITYWNEGPGSLSEVIIGQELAHFRMGSTIILILKKANLFNLDSLNEKKLVKFGSELISLKT